MTKPFPKRGEVWWVDAGMAAKTRPCVVLTDPPGEQDVDVFTVVFHTTKLRGNRWQIIIPKPFLKEGAFDVQEVNTVSRWRLESRLGELTPAELDAVLDRLAERLGI